MLWLHSVLVEFCHTKKYVSFLNVFKTEFVSYDGLYTMFLFVIPSFFNFSIASGGAVVAEKALVSRGVLNRDSLVFNMSIRF